MLSYRRIYNKPILVMIAVLALLSISGLTQSQESVEPDVLSGKVLLLEYEQGRFWELDTLTGDRMLVLEFEIQLGQIFDFQVIPSSQRIYVVEGIGCCGGIAAGPGQITQIDLKSGEHNVVFEGLNLLEMKVIPNTNDFMLIYFDPTLTRIKDETTWYCILNIDLQTCDHEVLEDFESIDWISRQQFIGTIKDDQGIRKSYLVNLESENRIVLPRAIQYWTPIPSVKDKVLTNGRIATTFDIFDLDTYEATTYRVAGDYDQLSAFYPVSLSPDGGYLLFRYQYTYLIAEFDTGEVVAEFDNTFDLQWLNDSTGIIYLYYPQSGNYPVQVVRYDLATNTSEVLAEFDERISIHVVQ